MERDERRLTGLLLLLIFSAVALALVTAEAEPDIFGRIAYARDAWARGEWIWRTDPYSYTAPGGRWVDHEWGFSWVAFLTYRLGGWFAIRLLRLGLMGATAWMCLSPTRAQPEAVRIRPVMGFVLALPLALGFIGPRPQAFSFLLFAWMTLCFARSWAGSLRWVLWGVAPMPLWVNLHGGFVAGMGVAVIWCLFRVPAAWTERDKKGLGLLVGALAWCAVSALASPWGWDYALFVYRTGTMARPFVEEWNPPKLLGVHWIFAALFAAAGLASALVRPRRWPNLAVMAVLAAQSFAHRRHLTFLAIAASAFAFPALAMLWNRLRPPERSPAPRALVGVVTATVGLTAVVVLGLSAVKLRAPPPHEPDWPTSALAFLRTRGSGGLLVDFNWAQYVIFEASPQFKVAVDGRYEEVYPNDLLDRYFAWHYGFDGWQALPADPATKFALVETNSSRAKRLEGLATVWQRLYSDPTATVFAKAEDASGTGTR